MGTERPGDLSPRAGNMTVARKPPTVWFTIRGFPFHIPRTPRRFFEEMSGGEALFPLIVLVGLNLVNQLDQTAFAVLGPDIRRSFDLSNQGYLTLVALTQLGGLLLAVPLAYYSDRLQRVAIAVIGAAVWGVFGIVTGLSVSVLIWRRIQGPVSFPTCPRSPRSCVFSRHRCSGSSGLCSSSRGVLSRR